MKAGNMTSALWTNAQARALRLYMSTEEPSYALVRLVNYLVHVYGPVLVAIRTQNNLTKGSYHLLQQVMAVNTHCTEDEKVVLFPIIEYSGYFSHPECVLVCMLGSEKEEERKRAVDVIMKIRRKKVPRPRGKKKIRSFKVRINIFSSLKSFTFFSGSQVTN